MTAYLNETMLRGYVEDFRVNVGLPEPLAELRQLDDGETPEGLAKEKFGGAVRDGHDLRYYENVLLYVNRGRAGIGGSYQDPGLLGGGSNHVKLYKGHRIWLVSSEYAKALESVVPSGSLTGGAVAKVKRFAGHLQDILQSVTESRHHFGEVAGEFAHGVTGEPTRDVRARRMWRAAVLRRMRKVQRANGGHRPGLGKRRGPRSPNMCHRLATHSVSGSTVYLSASSTSCSPTKAGMA